MWPRCHGGDCDETDEIEQVAWHVLTCQQNSSFPIGGSTVQEFLIHWGEHYCTSWERESNVFKYSPSSENIVRCGRGYL